MSKKETKSIDEKFNSIMGLVAEPSLEAKIFSERPVDDNVLSEEDKARIEAEAAAEVAKELKDAEIKAYKASIKDRLKKESLAKHAKDDKGEDLEPVLVTLSSHMPFIALDGLRYYHNQVYRLSRAKAATLKEIMFRGDLHVAELRGTSMKEFYGERPQGLRLTPSTAVPV